MSEDHKAKIPNNHVLAVLNSEDKARTAMHDLEAKGYSNVTLFEGEEVAETVDAKGENSNLLSKTLKAVQGHFSEEPNFLAQYEEEARAGHEVLAVEVDGQEKVDEVRDILELHGGHNIRFFGRLAVADLTPESNPTARSAESPEKWTET